MEDGWKINRNFLGEYKVITPEQQFLGIILWFLYVFKMVVDIAFLCKNAIEEIEIYLISMILKLKRLLQHFCKETQEPRPS